jgi:hypothetical protein
MRHGGHGRAQEHENKHCTKHRVAQPRAEKYYKNTEQHRVHTKVATTLKDQRGSFTRGRLMPATVDFRGSAGRLAAQKRVSLLDLVVYSIPGTNEHDIDVTHVKAGEWVSLGT